jgi:hypothetical protein
VVVPGSQEGSSFVRHWRTLYQFIASVYVVIRTSWGLTPLRFLAIFLQAAGYTVTVPALSLIGSRMALFWNTFQLADGGGLLGCIFLSAFR